MRRYNVLYTMARAFDVNEGLDPFGDRNRQYNLSLEGLVEHLRNNGDPKRAVDVKVSDAVPEELKQVLLSRLKSVSGKWKVNLQHFVQPHYTGKKDKQD